MKIHEIRTRTTPELNNALESFEASFRYPLGHDSWFRISHGDDYTRFFRAIGTPCCFVATQGSVVIGTVTSTICRLRGPYGEFGRAGYLADLKISDEASGFTLVRLFRRACDWTLAEPTPAFCVVMGGTAKSPDRYTGRLGIPLFSELAKVVILRIPVTACPQRIGTKPSPRIETCDRATSQLLYRQLTRDCFATDGGCSSTRSLMEPFGLIASDGSASGIVEDTRRSKRLFCSDGSEMVSAHLSCFGFRSIASAATLVLTALGHCSSLGIPALFVCVRPNDVAPLLLAACIDSGQTVEAPATVYGHGLQRSGNWSINTAEI